MLGTLRSLIPFAVFAVVYLVIATFVTIARREVDVPAAIEEMQLGGPDVTRHATARRTAPHDRFLRGGETGQGWRAANDKPVVLGDRRRHVVLAVVPKDLRVGTLAHERIFAGRSGLPGPGERGAGGQRRGCAEEPAPRQVSH